jgi:hypothetical protein
MKREIAEYVARCDSF